MRKVTLYWSNICILNRMENEALAKVKDTLKKEHIDLEISHFGIGQSYRMADYLSKEDAVLPDIFVSTDLEVIENDGIFRQFKDNLVPIEEYLPLVDPVKEHAINQWPSVTPFLYIPLVLLSNVPLETEVTLDWLIEQENMAFGGINNSAVPIVLKTLSDRYGQEKMEKFALKSRMFPMPINAFQAVRMGHSRMGIVPSVYTKVADNKNLFTYNFKEGCFALPSYVGVRNSLEPGLVELVLKTLFTEELCFNYSIQGDLPCVLKDYASKDAEHEMKLCYPSSKWFQSKESENFEEFYQKINQKKRVVL